MKDYIAIVFVFTTGILLASCAQSPETRGQLPATPEPPERNIIGQSIGDAVDPIPGFNVTPMSAEIGPNEAQAFDIRVDDLAIYRYGYYSMNSGEDWQNFTLNGVTKADWVIDGAERTLTIPGDDVIPDETEHIIIFSCSWEGEWNCHGPDGTPEWQQHDLNIVQADTCASDQCNYNGECVDPNGVRDEKICLDGAMQDLPDEPNETEEDEGPPPPPE